MVITDGVNTYTNLEEQIREESVRNSNTDTTLGFMTKNQADARKLKIESRIRVLQADMPILDSILSNFSVPKTYTPARLLLYKTVIAPMEVVIEDDIKIDQRLWAGEVVFWITINMIEASPA